MHLWQYEYIFNSCSGKLTHTLIAYALHYRYTLRILGGSHCDNNRFINVYTFYHEGNGGSGGGGGSGGDDVD